MFDITQETSSKFETPETSIKKDKENQRNIDPKTVYITKYLTANILFNLEPCNIV
jgi:hypothetical protein